VRAVGRAPRHKVRSGRTTLRWLRPTTRPGDSAMLTATLVNTLKIVAIGAPLSVLVIALVVLEERGAAHRRRRRRRPGRR